MSDDDEAILAFTPGPNCGRADGWAARRQTSFIHVLAVMGTVTRACKAVGMSRQTAYKLRERPDAADFTRPDFRVTMAALAEPPQPPARAEAPPQRRPTLTE